MTKEQIEPQKFLESEGKDEMYCEWFRCDRCEDSNIFAGANFCPNCGQDIRSKMPV